MKTKIWIYIACIVPASALHAVLEKAEATASGVISHVYGGLALAVLFIAGMIYGGIASNE